MSKKKSVCLFVCFILVGGGGFGWVLLGCCFFFQIISDRRQCVLSEILFRFLLNFVCRKFEFRLEQRSRAVGDFNGSAREHC